MSRISIFYDDDFDCLNIYVKNRNPVVKGEIAVDEEDVQFLVAQLQEWLKEREEERWAEDDEDECDESVDEEESETIEIPFRETAPETPKDFLEDAEMLLAVTSLFVESGQYEDVAKSMAEVSSILAQGAEKAKQLAEAEK